jgi:hypothetical protein
MALQLVKHRDNFTPAVAVTLDCFCLLSFYTDIQKYFRNWNIVSKPTRIMEAVL